MATNGMTPGENAKIVASMVTDDDLDELKKLHSDLQDRIDQARKDGRLFMMSQYVRLLALVTPEVDRIQKRFNRETLAMHRKYEKALKLEKKAEAGAATA
jgi:hypothetical protein